jgi:hypothetical protein
MVLVYVERIREVRGDEISEKTQSHVIKGTATIVRVLQYTSTGSNTNQVGEGKDEARRAVDRYIPVKVVTSELKKVERAIWRCTGLKL